MIKPSMVFDNFEPPPPPNYKDLNSWAAHPYLKNGPDQLTPNNENLDFFKNAAVFYIHPTGYFGKTWNATIDKDTPHYERTEGMLAGQASAFNASCDIYAPEYRQATFFSFFDETGDGQKALARAYEDVENAFFEFLELIGDKPFFIASHSQGTLHGQQLISKHIDGTDLSKRMIAAYLIGYPILKNDIKKLFKKIEICKSPEQVNCLIAWCTVDEMANLDGESWSWDPGGWKRLNRNDSLFGTNPISWTVDNEWISTEQRNSVLDLDIKRFDAVEFGLGNLHVVDYSLFWGSIRENVKLRLNEYLKKQN